ncbi:flagellar biosynthetic protein FliR [Moellerella wisconsensis]|uniref:Flagellar biosynthetic protein FliR n=1 Tax=Moellerella wisconsensis ATCC 35017 TaxID=1354267 RepID=A0A0N0I9T5_9GAMM|nr:flagellar biosynthetic protein FliR [Moellerella wisconsensis]KLN96290.1 hypothetical protein VK86_10640 [Moellerella wisconsensis]KPD02330.1 FliR family flagellar biosynthesis protein [Moellerella wisconsensis ATCC 35017]VFS53990.1 flagellar biosynthesis protein FliR [Moellerella wisconsensis]
MITLNTTELLAILNQYFYIVVRLLAFMTIAPLFSEKAFPKKIKLLLALSISILVFPNITTNKTAILSLEGVMIIILQMIIGLLIGFALQFMIVTVKYIGELIGMQMGLSFAMFVDPSGGPNMPVISRFLNLIFILLLFSFNTHLWFLYLLVDSFNVIPISSIPLNKQGIWLIIQSAGYIFLYGLLFSLPFIFTLLMINIALGILNRMTPQLSVFVIGFPITMLSGIIIIFFSLPLFPAFSERIISSNMDFIFKSIEYLN